MRWLVLLLVLLFSASVFSALSITADILNNNVRVDLNYPDGNQLIMESFDINMFFGAGGLGGDDNNDSIDVNIGYSAVAYDNNVNIATDFNATNPANCTRFTSATIYWDCNYTINSEGLIPDGNWFINIRATDHNDVNYAASSMSFVIDNNAPTSLWITPTADLNTRERTIAFDVNRVALTIVKQSSIWVQITSSASDNNSGVFSNATHCSNTDDGNFRCSYVETDLNENLTYDVNITFCDVVQSGNCDENTMKIEFIAIDGNIISHADKNAELYYISGATPVDFNVYSIDRNWLYIDLNYSALATEGTGTAIFNDRNTSHSTITCDYTDYNFSLNPICRYSWDTTTAADGNYYLIMDVNNGGKSQVFYAGTLNFMLDNTAPTVSVTSYASNTWEDNRFPSFTMTPADSGSDINHSMVKVYKNGVVYQADLNIWCTTTCTWNYTGTALTTGETLKVTWNTFDRATNKSTDTNSGTFYFLEATSGSGGGGGGGTAGISPYQGFFVKMVSAYYPYTDTGYGIELSPVLKDGTPIPAGEIDSFELVYYDSKDNSLYKADSNEAKVFSESFLFVADGDWIHSIDYVTAIVKIGNLVKYFNFDSRIELISNFTAERLAVSVDDENNYYFSVDIRNGIPVENNFTMDCWVEDSRGNTVYSCDIDEFVLNAYEERRMKKVMGVANLAPEEKYNLFVSVYGAGSNAKLLLKDFEKTGKGEIITEPSFWEQFSILAILDTTLVPIRMGSGDIGGAAERVIEIKVWMLLAFVGVMFLAGYITIDTRKRRVKLANL